MIFSRKKFAQCHKKLPKWRNFAQSGHPGNGAGLDDKTFTDVLNVLGLACPIIGDDIFVNLLNIN